MMKIILIGGESHRQRIDVENYKNILLIPLPPSASIAPKNYHPEQLKFEQYTKHLLFFGEHEPIKDVFFIDGTDPMLWCKNIILDYLK